MCGKHTDADNSTGSGAGWYVTQLDVIMNSHFWISLFSLNRQVKINAINLVTYTAYLTTTTNTDIAERLVFRVRNIFIMKNIYWHTCISVFTLP
jgi:hypothetical protein